MYQGKLLVCENLLSNEPVFFFFKHSSIVYLLYRALYQKTSKLICAVKVLQVGVMSWEMNETFTSGTSSAEIASPTSHLYKWAHRHNNKVHVSCSTLLTFSSTLTIFKTGEKMIAALINLIKLSSPAKEGICSKVSSWLFHTSLLHCFVILLVWSTLWPDC